MDQNLQILLYFGALALLGALATVAALVVMRRESANKERHKRLRKRPDEDTSTPPRQIQVQLVWAGEEMPLIWMVEGRPYAHRDNVEPEHRPVIEQFIKKLGETLPEMAVALPVPAPRPVAIEAPPPVEESAEIAESVEERDASEIAEPGVAEEIKEIDPPPSVETPVPPPSERPAPSRARNYEEMMELPFLERLKASFFGPPTPSAASRLDQAERQALPSLPKVDDLNTILQKRLVLLPDVPPASIRPNAQGVLEIVVEGKLYERIDDVPNERVRETMREAVRLWEQEMG